MYKVTIYSYESFGHGLNYDITKESLPQYNRLAKQGGCLMLSN